MNDEAKLLDWKWLNWWTAAAIFVVLLVGYQSAHYATAASVSEPGCCCLICSHAIAGKEAPEWVDHFFSLAYRIDELLGVNPWSRR